MDFYRHWRSAERGGVSKANPVVARWRRKLALCAGSRLGSTTVEFAFAVPVLLFLVLGLIEFGRALWIQHTLEFAVQQATRFAIVSDDASATDTAFKSTIRTVAGNFLTGLNAADVTFAVTFEKTGSTRDIVMVTASYTFSVVGSTDVISAGSFDLTSKSRLAFVQ